MIPYAKAGFFPPSVMMATEGEETLKMFDLLDFYSGQSIFCADFVDFLMESR